MEAFVKVYLYRKDLFEDPEVQAAFKEKYGYDLAPATTFAQYRDNRRVLHRLWQGERSRAVGHHGAGDLRPSGVVLRVLRDDRADLRRLQLGHQPRRPAPPSVENGGTMNSDRGQGRRWPSGSTCCKYAPPEATSSTWDEVAASFAAGRAAQGWVYGENAAWIATDRRPLGGGRQGRRRPAADRRGRDRRRPRPAKATSATTTAAPSASRTPRRTRRRRCSGCSISASPRSRPTGRSPARASSRPRPTTTPRSRSRTPRSTATTP